MVYGGDSSRYGLNFHIDSISQANVDREWSDLGLANKKVLGIHPGSEPTVKQKRMGTQRYRAVIQQFLDRFPEARVAVFLGPGELDLASCFSDIDQRVVVVSSTALREVGSMVSRTQVLLAGDTALGHIGSALGVPVVTLAGPTQTSSTKPWGDGNFVIRTQEELHCMPCYGTPLYGKCPYDLRCMNSISEVAIVDALSAAFR